MDHKQQAANMHQLYKLIWVPLNGGTWHLAAPSMDTSTSFFKGLMETAGGDIKEGVD